MKDTHTQTETEINSGVSVESRNSVCLLFSFIVCGTKYLCHIHYLIFLFVFVFMYSVADKGLISVGRRSIIIFFFLFEYSYSSSYAAGTKVWGKP